MKITSLAYDDDLLIQAGRKGRVKFGYKTLVVGKKGLINLQYDKPFFCAKDARGIFYLCDDEDTTSFELPSNLRFSRYELLSNGMDAYLFFLCHSQGKKVLYIYSSSEKLTYPHRITNFSSYHDGEKLRLSVLFDKKVTTYDIPSMEVVEEVQLPHYGLRITASPDEIVTYSPHFSIYSRRTQESISFPAPSFLPLCYQSRYSEGVFYFRKSEMLAILGETLKVYYLEGCKSEAFAFNGRKIATIHHHKLLEKDIEELELLESLPRISRSLPRHLPSLGERIIRDAIHPHYKVHEEWYLEDHCFDFMVEVGDKRVIVEYDGKQHFRIDNVIKDSFHMCTALRNGYSVIRIAEHCEKGLKYLEEALQEIRSNSIHFIIKRGDFFSYTTHIEKMYELWEGDVKMIHSIFS